MERKQQLYEVKLALKGRLYDIVKIQTHDLKSIPDNHKILSYKKIEKQK